MKQQYKRKKILVLGAECIGVILFIIYQMANYEAFETTFLREEMYVRDVQGNLAPGSYIDASFKDNEGIVTPNISLEKGIYYITFEYEEHGIVNAALVYEEPRNQKELVNDNEFTVNRKANRMDYRVKISDTSNVHFRVRLTGDAVDGDYVNLAQVHIMRSKLTYVYQISCFLVLVLMIDILLLLFRYYTHTSRQKQMVIITLSLTMLVTSLPLFRYGVQYHIDLPFHLMRIEGLFEGLKGGQFPVRIQPGWIEGYGYAASVFYGDIFLYLPALFRMAGFTLQEAFKIYIIAINIGTTLIAYYSFRRMFKDDMTALTGAVLYTASFDRLFRLYSCAHIGTFSAMTFYPLVLAGLYVLFTEDIYDKKYKNTWVILTLGFSGLLMTHFISCLMIGILTVILCIVMVKRLFRKNTLLELVKAVIAGILLNLWFLLPFAYYFLSGKIGIASGIWGREESINYYARLADFMEASIKLSDVFLQSEGIGYALSLVFILYIVSIPFQKKGEKARQGRVLFCITALTIIMCTNIFPVIGVAKISIIFLKLFLTIQYQSRFISVVMILLSALTCFLMEIFAEHKRYVYLCAMLLGVFAIYQDFTYFDMLETDSVYLEPIDLIAGTGDSNYTYGVVNGEYLPVGTDLSNISREIMYNKEAVEISEAKKDYLTFTMTINNLSGEEQDITLPLLYYDGYMSNGLETNEKFITCAGDNNRVCIRIPAGYSGKVQIGYKEFWFFRMAEAISLTAIIFGIWLLVKGLKISGSLFKDSIQALKVEEGENEAKRKQNNEKRDN